MIRLAAKSEDGVEEWVTKRDKVDLLLDWDQIFGLRLNKVSSFEFRVSDEVKELVAQREQLRQQKKWDKADEIRKQIEKLGFALKDTFSGSKLTRI